MIVRDDFNQKNTLEYTSEDYITSLNRVINEKEKEIELIRNKISKYEDKKRAEEAFYRSLSPVRKFFASKSPSHHQAVEYMVHVKERLKLIDKISQRITEVEQAIDNYSEQSSDQEIVLSNSIFEELKILKEMEDSDS